MSTERVAGTSGYEESNGYSRAIAFGPWVISAGTTATRNGVVQDPGDAAGQTRTAFTIALEAMAELGVTAADVVRTRMYVTDIADMAAIGAVHRELFGASSPVATMVQISGLADPAHLIEVEVEAYRADR